MADMLGDVRNLGLTPGELNKVLYHRKNMANPLMTPDGPATIYATGIEVPEGPFKGKFASVPGLVNGKIIEDEDELWKVWQKEINDGKWPVYNSSKELNARDEWLHQIMERDMMPAREEEVDPFYSDPFEFSGHR